MELRGKVVVVARATTNVGLALASRFVGSEQRNPELQNLADLVVNGIRNEYFMIS